MTEKTITVNDLQAILWDALHPGLSNNQVALMSAYSTKSEENAKRLISQLADRGYTITRVEESPRSLADVIAMHLRIVFLDGSQGSWRDVGDDERNAWLRVVVEAADRVLEEVDGRFQNTPSQNIYEVIDNLRKELGAGK